MKAKEFSHIAREQHCNLANRLTAILSAGVADAKLSFLDAGEAPVAGSRNVLLDMANAPSIAPEPVVLLG